MQNAYCGREHSELMGLKDDRGGNRRRQRSVAWWEAGGAHRDFGLESSGKALEVLYRDDVIRYEF